ncbi:MAG TPA: glycogen/starch/alpha-glucan phosphorylase [Vicinamibacteria bacterium]|nr:glycogen/starch/alpha-glucan phosphorylase [Vicinamibacteria bacterium]
MSEEPGRPVHVLSLEAGSDRWRELAGLLRSEGRAVRETPPGPPQSSDEARLRLERTRACAAAREVLEGEGLLLLADERAAMAAAEMVRLLLDERGLGWEQAWSEVRGRIVARMGTPKSEPARPFWTVEHLAAEAPRLLDILYEINRRHLDEVEARWPGDLDRRQRLSLFREDEPKRLRAGLLAVLAARRVDVALPWDGPYAEALADLSVLHGRQLHGRPTPVRPRWLLEANPALAALVADALGPGWEAAPTALAGLEALAFDAAFAARFRALRRGARERLGAMSRRGGGPGLDPDSLVDVRLWAGTPQERPLLNVLGLVREHLRLAVGGWTPPCPRSFVFAGPEDGRVMPLVRTVAAAVAADGRSRRWLSVLALADPDDETVATLAAAADLSNQPGAAGSGAAGARALGLALNGAVTLGTRDGTVRELTEAVGEENLFLFGLTPVEGQAWREGQVYRPQDVYAIDPLVRLALDTLGGTRYASDPQVFAWARRDLLDPQDPWLVLADVGSYLHRQDEALAEFAYPPAFTGKAIVTLARAQRFRADRLELSD